MKKAKKTKAPTRKATELDRLAARIRTALRRETKNIIEIGKLLIESRKRLEHGEWQAWLAENFDLGYRTAINYVNAAEYVASKGKGESISHFANLSANVLYRLAAGQFNEQEEAAILAEAKAGKRIDEDAAWAIRDALAPPDDDDAVDAADEDDGGHQDDSGDDSEDAESAAILDGPPPAVPPTAPAPPPTNFALRDFDDAIGKLKQLMTKRSADFASTTHSAEDLENVGDFIRAVRERALSNPQ
jgi:hypothetical protein